LPVVAGPLPDRDQRSASHAVCWSPPLGILSIGTFLAEISANASNPIVDVRSQLGRKVETSHIKIESAASKGN